MNPHILRSSENEYSLQLRNDCHLIYMYVKLGNEIVPFWVVWSHGGVYSVLKEPSTLLEVTEGMLLSVCETAHYCNL